MELGVMIYKFCLMELMETSKNSVVTKASWLCSALGFYGILERGRVEIKLDSKRMRKVLNAYNLLFGFMGWWWLCRNKSWFFVENCVTVRVSEWLRAINQEANRGFFFFFEEDASFCVESNLNEKSRAKTRTRILAVLTILSCVVGFISGWTMTCVARSWKLIRACCAGFPKQNYFF